MWIYIKARSERDNRFVINLDLCSRINLNQLGERWFIEVMLEGESVPLASADTREDASSILNSVFEAIRSGERALDLESQGTPRKETVPNK